MALECRFRVEGHLSDRWSDWFDGLQITNRPDGQAELTGLLTDRTALYGVVDRLRDLGVLLLSLDCTPRDPATAGHDGILAHES